MAERIERMVAASEWRRRISMDPAIHHGDPCIAGTRIPISVIVGSVADGDSIEQVLESWPQLKREDVRAALLCAAEAVNRFDMIPLQSYLEGHGGGLQS